MEQKGFPELQHCKNAPVDNSAHQAVYCDGKRLAAAQGRSVRYRCRLPERTEDVMAAPRNSDLKNHILESTSLLLQRKNFDDISLSDIARQAGVSKGTLYYYYNSKDDILFDITDRYLRVLADDLLTWLNDKTKDTSAARLLTYALQRGSSGQSGNLRLYLIGAAVSGGHDAVRSRYIERYRFFQQTLEQRIAERIPQADASYLSWFLLTVMDGILVQGQLGNPDFCAGEFVQKTVEMMMSSSPMAVDSSEKEQERCKENGEQP
ncbi:MAG: TetR/AcrR family transcriptional regulator [Angelakisella sp.]